MQRVLLMELGSILIILIYTLIKQTISQYQRMGCKWKIFKSQLGFCCANIVFSCLLLLVLGP